VLELHVGESGWEFGSEGIISFGIFSINSSIPL
jgi:hypothetical protein